MRKKVISVLGIQITSSQANQEQVNNITSGKRIFSGSHRPPAVGFPGKMFQIFFLLIQRRPIFAS